MDNLERLKAQLGELGVSGFLLPSSDEYLSEYAQPPNRWLRWLLGFTGSTGTAVVLANRTALIVDGRYTEQGARETKDLGVDIVNVDDASKSAWFEQHMRPGSRLGIDGRLHALVEMQATASLLAKIGIEVVDLPQNPIDLLWTEDRPQPLASIVHDYPVELAGSSRADKIAHLVRELDRRHVDWHLVADPEDVAWLLNIRTDDSQTGAHPVPIPLCRALVSAKGKVHLFLDPARLDKDLRGQIDGAVAVHPPSEFEAFLNKNTRVSVVSTNLRKIPYRYARAISAEGSLVDDQVLALKRWIKHPNEIAVSREAHYKDGLAVIRFLAWLQETIAVRRITELDAAAEITRLRQSLNNYRGNSMRVLSASGPNSALAHYTPSQKTNRALNDHPMYTLDSGGHYPGSTDNTVCFAVGTPEAKHIVAHTLVVKGWMALTRARFPDGLYSTQLDSFARQFLWQEGMDYGHGTSHGVGNFMNIHEGPYIRKEIAHPLVTPMRAGMIISNEPAYYEAGDFGIRVESHMLTKDADKPGYLEFETLSKLPIDPRLIDWDLMTADERRWLAAYHDDIAQTYAGAFDPKTTAWLSAIVSQFQVMAA